MLTHRHRQRRRRPCKLVFCVCLSCRRSRATPRTGSGCVCVYSATIRCVARPANKSARFYGQLIAAAMSRPPSKLQRARVSPFWKRPILGAPEPRLIVHPGLLDAHAAQQHWALCIFSPHALGERVFYKGERSIRYVFVNCAVCSFCTERDRCTRLRRRAKTRASYAMLCYSVLCMS